MDACADPGISTTGVQPRLPENNLFYSFAVVYQWFISKKTITVQGFRGGPTFSRCGGGSTFSIGVGGPNDN